MIRVLELVTRTCSGAGPTAATWLVIVVVAVAGVLAVVGAGAAAGWHHAKGRGRGPARGALRGAVLVVAGACALATLWIAAVAWSGRSARHADVRDAREQAVRAVAALRPGSLRDDHGALASATPSFAAAALLDALAERLETESGWTEADWHAVAALERQLRPGLERDGADLAPSDRVRVAVVWSERGEAGYADLAEACRSVACRAALDARRERTDAALIRAALAQRSTFGLEPVDASTRAALERGAQRGTGGDGAPALAWVRLRRGAAEHALGACAALHAPALPLEGFVRRCLGRLAAPLAAHGAARLCPAGDLDAADAAALGKASTVLRGIDDGVASGRWNDALATLRAGCGAGPGR